MGGERISSETLKLPLPDSGSPWKASCSCSSSCPPVPPLRLWSEFSSGHAGTVLDLASTSRGTVFRLSRLEEGRGVEETYSCGLYRLTRQKKKKSRSQLVFANSGCPLQTWRVTFLLIPLIMVAVRAALRCSLPTRQRRRPQLVTAVVLLMSGYSARP
jgi:hypothetical protein